MDLRFVLRGLSAVLLLLFHFSPSEGHLGQAPPSTHDLATFPPFKPTEKNVQHVCNNWPNVPRYQLDTLPKNWYSYLRRQATAVNMLASLYQECCGSDKAGDEILNCALGAWKTALTDFCEAEYSVKTRFYHCCIIDVDLDCFAQWAPKPPYKWAPELPRQQP